MNHDRWTDRLSAYIDDELPAAERAELEAHLAGCVACVGTLAELRTVVRAAHSLTDAAPERDLWAGIAEHIETPVLPLAAPRAARRFSFTLPQLAAASVALVAVSSALVWALLAHGPSGANGSLATAPVASPAASSSNPAPATQVAVAAPSAEPTSPETAPAPAAEGKGSAPVLASGGQDGRTAGAPASAARRAAPGTVILASDAERRRYDAAVMELEAVIRKGRGQLQPETIQALEQSLAVIDNAIADARRALARDPGSAYLNAHLADNLRRKVELLQQASTLVGQS